MAADIRTITEAVAVIQATGRFNEERMTELRGRVRDLERK
jgi:hypothetical protein